MIFNPLKKLRIVALWAIKQHLLYLHRQSNQKSFIFNKDLGNIWQHKQQQL